MKTQRGRRWTAAAAFVGMAGTALLHAPAMAQGQDGGFRGRVWAGAVGRYVLNDNDPFVSPGFGTVELMVKGSGPAIGTDMEYKFGRWVGLDVAAAYTRLNVHFTSSNAPGADPSENFGVVPVLLSLNLHVISVSKVDFWVGPQIGYVVFPDNLSYAVSGSGTFTYKPKSVSSTEGFALGADIWLNSKWALNIAGRWQDADGDGDGHLTIDPTLVTIGLTRKMK